MALTRIISEIIENNTIENRDISASFTAGISGSWRGELSSSNMTVVGGGVSGSVTSTGSFGRVEAAGVVFADSFESVAGGATIDFNDNISLTGNLTATGNISSSFTSTGSFGRVQTTNIDIDSISGNWTNAGNTVADLGTVTTADINGGTIDGITSLTAGGDLDIGAHDLRAATITADSLTATRVPFAGTDGVLSDDSDLTFATATLSATNLTTTGTIKNMALVSGSSVSTGSFGRVQVLTADIGLTTGTTGSFGYVHATTEISSSVGKFNSVDINGGTIDGITSLTAGGDLDIGAHDLRASTLTADSLTATRVPFAGTAGVLSDDSDLTFATATLSATNLTTTGTIKNMALVSG